MMLFILCHQFPFVNIHCPENVSATTIATPEGYANGDSHWQLERQSG